MGSPLLNYTPVDYYRLAGDVDFYVKREDLVTSKLAGAPPFAKVRGLYPVLSGIKRNGCGDVAYVDTAISMGGWGVAYFAKLLGLGSYIFYPCYKDGLRHEQEFQLLKWRECGAFVVPIKKPARLSMNRAFASHWLKEKEIGAVLLPQGLKFRETVIEVSREVGNIRSIGIRSIVVCVGSGVMLAGVLKGLVEYEVSVDCVVGVAIASGKDLGLLKNKVMNLAGVVGSGGLVIKGLMDFVKEFYIVDSGYRYEEYPSSILPPFPCNKYYDLKAYEWMLCYYGSLPKPVLFWNVGA